MPQFGTTSPCAEIAKHFGVDQAIVDAAMEWRLYRHGIRRTAPTHVQNYYTPPETVMGDWGFILDALDAAIHAIFADAEKRRAAMAAAAR